ncbi:MAG: protein kinase [Lachnospiraceae bacterium]|nr:protein kinase [Lachnospiraceae bacterium]
MFNTGDILKDTYEIIGPIGKGGIGTIYKARHLRLSTEVVIKQWETTVTGDINSRGEADILKQLRHTYLPQVYDYVQIGSVVYTVLDFIPGNDLQYYLDNGYQFSSVQLYKWFHQLCEALQYLHSQEIPIIHSDIKPGNIMIKPDGNICLIDFNISLAESTETLKGISETYASPEQYAYAASMMNGMVPSGPSIDTRTDIYSLGATFYHLMTYIPPSCHSETINPITAFELPYPESFVEIIEKCMAPLPRQRYQSAAQLLKVLDRINTQDKRVKRLRFIRLVTNLLLLVSLAAGSIVTYYGYCLKSLEEFDAVYVSYTEAVSGADSTEEIFTLTEELLNRSDAKMSLNREPDIYYPIYLNMANSYRDMDDLENADTYYQMILSLEQADIYLNYAIYQVKTEAYSDATATLNKSLRLGVAQGEAYYVKGLISEGKGDIDDAILQYRKAIIQLEDGSHKTDAQNRLSALEGGK